jgi:transposase InsO family protein
MQRSRLTDLNEFWFHHAPTEDEIDQRLEEWQFDYNWRRPHGSLGGKTPVDRIAEVGEITPLSEQVQNAYDERKERIRHREWRVDKTLAEHHRRVLEENGHHESEMMSVNRTRYGCSSIRGNHMDLGGPPASGLSDCLRSVFLTHRCRQDELSPWCYPAGAPRS